MYKSVPHQVLSGGLKQVTEEGGEGSPSGVIFYKQAEHEVHKTNIDNVRVSFKIISPAEESQFH